MLNSTLSTLTTEDLVLGYDLFLNDTSYIDHDYLKEGYDVMVNVSDTRDNGTWTNGDHYGEEPVHIIRDTVLLTYKMAIVPLCVIGWWSSGSVYV